MTEVRLVCPWEPMKVPSMDSHSVHQTVDGFVRYSGNRYLILATVYPTREVFAVRLSIDLELGGYQFLAHSMEEARELADLKLKEAGFKLLSEKHMSLF